MTTSYVLLPSLSILACRSGRNTMHARGELLQQAPQPAAKAREPLAPWEKTSILLSSLTRDFVMAAPIPALPPVTMAYLPASMSFFHGNGGSSGAGLPVGMVVLGVAEGEEDGGGSDREVLGEKCGKGRGDRKARPDGTKKKKDFRLLLESSTGK